MPKPEDALTKLLIEIVQLNAILARIALALEGEKAVKVTGQIKGV